MTGQDTDTFPSVIHGIVCACMEEVQEQALPKEFAFHTMIMRTIGLQ